MKKQPAPQPAPTNGAPPLMNRLLPDNMQGSAYKVVGFRVIPIVSVLDKAGLERARFEPSLAVQVLASQFFTPIPKLMKDAGLPMESRKK